MASSDWHCLHGILVAMYPIKADSYVHSCAQNNVCHFLFYQLIWIGVLRAKCASKPWYSDNSARTRFLHTRQACRDSHLSLSKSLIGARMRRIHLSLNRNKLLELFSSYSIKKNGKKVLCMCEMHLDIELQGHWIGRALPIFTVLLPSRVGIWRAKWPGCGPSFF
jgi:hypothetical protein